MSFRLLQTIWGDARGGAFIESAIAFPVFFALFFGVFEFSWFFYEQHRVSTGIRDAARYVARLDSRNLDWSVLPPNIPIAVQGDAANLATTGARSGISCPSTCRVPGWVPADVSVVPDSSVDGSGITIYEVRVSTTFTPNSLGFLGFLRLGPFTVRVEHDERLQQPCPTCFL
jgi:hypothetical protein